MLLCHLATFSHYYLKWFDFSGNVLDVIKVIAEDAVHVWKERTEITTDCKAVSTDWQGQDFKGSGKAVGDIVGIILQGL